MAASWQQKENQKALIVAVLGAPENEADCDLIHANICALLEVAENWKDRYLHYCAGIIPPCPTSNGSGGPG